LFAFIALVNKNLHIFNLKTLDGVENRHPSSNDYDSPLG